jgi:2-hydroxy-3-keto-5-methylthiopentenyl-1-phosphate phosphatase
MNAPTLNDFVGMVYTSDFEDLLADALGYEEQEDLRKTLSE